MLCYIHQLRCSFQLIGVIEVSQEIYGNLQVCCEEKNKHLESPGKLVAVNFHHLYPPKPATQLPNKNGTFTFPGIQHFER